MGSLLMTHYYELYDHPLLNARLSLLCATHTLPCLWRCCCCGKHPDGRLEETRLNYDWVWRGITGV